MNLASYVRALAASIGQQVENVAVEVAADEVQLLIDRAVPLGLIVNEAATNSIKHAFGASGGSIHVKLAGGIGYGEARLTVSDNGRGMGEMEHHGSGLKLIASLARQIGGSLEQRSSSTGTTISIVFPLINPRKAEGDR